MGETLQTLRHKIADNLLNCSNSRFTLIIITELARKSGITVTLSVPQIPVKVYYHDIIVTASIL